MSFNLATVLTETTQATPDAEVCRFGGAATTYRELDEQSGRLAAGLPQGSLLAAEFASVARSIDVAGVLGAWRLDALARESGEAAE